MQWKEQIIKRLEKLNDKKTSSKLIEKVYQSIFILDHNNKILMVYYANATDYTEYKIGHVSQFLKWKKAPEKVPHIFGEFG